MMDLFKARGLPIAKSAIILCLAGLSVVLTVQLWLVNIPNRSFFPYMQARFASAAPDGADDLVRPFRIVSGAGDGFFDITYSDIAESSLWEIGQTAIRAVLQGGNFIRDVDADATYILDNAVVIYQYAFCMDPRVFAQTFGARSGVLVDAGVQSFRAVAISPTPDGVDIYFIREEEIWVFSRVLLGNMYIPSLANLDIPSAQQQYRRFVIAPGFLTFVQDFHTNFTYHPILITNPYENASGLRHIPFIRSQIEHFFDVPATINSGVPGGIYTFSNINTVVRYLPWDVVEYTSFRTIGRAVSSSFVADFSAALDFVNSDPNVSRPATEIYLAGYDVRGREHVFWFGYTLGNFPLVLAEPWYTGPSCTAPLIHPIEVVVDHGRVISYRKIAFAFSIDTSVTAALAPNVGQAPLVFAIGTRAREHMILEGS